MKTPVTRPKPKPPLRVPGEPGHLMEAKQCPVEIENQPLFEQ